VKADASRNGGAADSVAKLRAVMQLCDECGVLRHPAQLGGLLLVPLLSWHHKVRCAGLPPVPRLSLPAWLAVIHSCLQEDSASLV
jgi:hypothetical protein